MQPGAYRDSRDSLVCRLALAKRVDGARARAAHLGSLRRARTAVGSVLAFGALWITFGTTACGLTWDGLIRWRVPLEAVFAGVWLASVAGYVVLRMAGTRGVEPRLTGDPARDLAILSRQEPSERARERARSLERPGVVMPLFGLVALGPPTIVLGLIALFTEDGRLSVEQCLVQAVTPTLATHLVAVAGAFVCAVRLTQAVELSPLETDAEHRRRFRLCVIVVAIAFMTALPMLLEESCRCIDRAEYPRHVPVGVKLATLAIYAAWPCAILGGALAHVRRTLLTERALVGAPRS